jgi:hypothetical protein
MASETNPASPEATAARTELNEACEQLFRTKGLTPWSQQALVVAQKAAGWSAQLEARDPLVIFAQAIQTACQDFHAPDDPAAQRKVLDKLGQTLVARSWDTVRLAVGSGAEPSPAAKQTLIDRESQRPSTREDMARVLARPPGAATSQSDPLTSLEQRVAALIKKIYARKVDIDGVCNELSTMVSELDSAALNRTRWRTDLEELNRLLRKAVAAADVPEGNRAVLEQIEVLAAFAQTTGQTKSELKKWFGRLVRPLAENQAATRDRWGELVQSLSDRAERTPDDAAINSYTETRLEVLRPLVDVQPATEGAGLRELALALAEATAFASQLGQPEKVRTCGEEAMVLLRDELKTKPDAQDLRAALGRVEQQLAKLPPFPTPRLVLAVRQPGRAVKFKTFSPGVHWIGSESAAQVQLSAPGVRVRHAVLQFDDRKAVFLDMGVSESGVRTSTRFSSLTVGEVHSVGEAVLEVVSLSFPGEQKSTAEGTTAASASTTASSSTATSTTSSTGTSVPASASASASASDPSPSVNSASDMSPSGGGSGPAGLS